MSDPITIIEPNVTIDEQDLFYFSKTHQLILAKKTSKGLELLSETKDPHTISNNSAIEINDPEQLSISNDEVYVIDSIKSGTGRTQSSSVYHNVLKPIFDEYLNINHHYVSTTSSDSISKFAESFQPSNRPITVILISGDSSINEFVNSLSSLKSRNSIKLFTIPSGTGNSLALSLNIESELQSIKKLIEYKLENVKPLNIYEAKFPSHSHIISQGSEISEINQPLKFLVVLSWGFHASLVADSDTPELRQHGIDRFKLAAMSNLQETQKYEGDISINDKIIHGPFAYLVITLSQKFEPTFEVLPRGNILENSLYLISFQTIESDKSGKYILDIMGEVYNQGKHVENEDVTYEKFNPGSEITLNIKNADSIRKRRFCLDGSIIALPEVNEQKVVIKSIGNVQNNWELFVIT